MYIFHKVNVCSWFFFLRERCCSDQPVIDVQNTFLTLADVVAHAGSGGMAAIVSTEGKLFGKNVKSHELKYYSS